MGYVEFRTINGWVGVEDALIADETCAICKVVGKAEGNGYRNLESAESITWLCRLCRVNN